MNSFYSFIYLDEDIIESLYPQILGDVIESKIAQVVQNESTASINGTLLGGISSSLSEIRNDSYTKSAKLSRATPRKAQLLIEYFRKAETDIFKIISNNQHSEESIFFVGKTVFFLSDIYNNENGVSLFYSGNSYVKLDSNSTIVLEAGSTNFLQQRSSEYTDADDYFEINMSKQENYGIMMHLSNSKIQKNIRHLTQKIKTGKHFKFYVFGQLVKSSFQFYKIVPFAIWQ